MYDPTQIRIDEREPTIADLIPQIDIGRSEEWDTCTNSLLIESILVRLPIQDFWLDSRETRPLKIVDGRKRLWAIAHYLDDGYPLTRLDYLAKLEGLRFGELPPNLRRRLIEARLIVRHIKPGTAPENFEYIKQLLAVHANG